MRPFSERQPGMGSTLPPRSGSVRMWPFNGRVLHEPRVSPLPGGMSDPPVRSPFRRPPRPVPSPIDAGRDAPRRPRSSPRRGGRASGRFRHLYASWRGRRATGQEEGGSRAGKRSRGVYAAHLTGVRRTTGFAGRRRSPDPGNQGRETPLALPGCYRTRAPNVCIASPRETPPNPPFARGGEKRGEPP
jgi:hypothetical protein